jgi:hypothetical protein
MSGRLGAGASRRRLALWLVLALGVVLIALLATGLLRDTLVVRAPRLRRVQQQ